jgi:hypothetical protein
MNGTRTIEVPVTFPHLGRASLTEPDSGVEAARVAPGRVSRVARLMALALRLDELVRTGQVGSSSALATLGPVTRARISQILNLIHLAPDLQEALLFLPTRQRGRDPIILADLQPIAAAFDWRQQRRLWRRLVAD